jgi:endonuclease/exonuclease/phosphatase family metal-dependent hydrolase
LRRLFFWLAVAGLAAPAVPLTLNRLADGDAGPAVRVMAFTPFATPFYLLAVLLLGGTLALGRGGPRKVVAPVAVVLAAALGLHLWWLAPLYVGGNPGPADGATSYVVMNLNLYEGNADGDDVMRLAAERDVDVLVLQEVTFRALREMEAAGVRDVYPSSVGEPNGAVDGSIVFSRLPISEVVRLDTLFQSWQVTLGEGADAFTLLGVHPRAPVDLGGADQWRSENAAVLAAAEAADADLVLGDFNATPDHAPMRAWRDAGWRDSLELVNAGWSRTWPANGISPARELDLPPLIQIDHVLVGHRFAVTASDVVEIAGTDHRAVLATVARR